MGNGVPAPQNFGQAAQQQANASQQNVNAQTLANRPNQYNPNASLTWTQGPNGQWQQSTQFNGPLAGLNDSLQQQAAQAMGQPFSLSGLPELTDGAAARQQAIDAAYGDATKRLEPQFQQRESELRQRLLGQGLVEGSEAYNNAMQQFGAQRNDAFNSAMNSAIGQGTQAGQALFQQSLTGRQNALAEALRQRGQAFGELQGLQGLTGQQGFMGAGLAQAPDYLGAASLQGQQDWNRYTYEQQQLAQMLGAGGDLAAQLAPLAAKALPFLLCDERAKQDVRRLVAEAYPGVPQALWRYREGYGDPSILYMGVIAQDLQRVAPEYVRTRHDGLLEVHPAFSPVEV